MGRSEIEAGSGSDDRQWSNSSSQCISDSKTPINCHGYVSGWTMSYAMLGDVAGFRAGPPLSLSHWITTWDEFDFLAAKSGLHELEIVP
jgi:hypothetical protein